MWISAVCENETAQKERCQDEQTAAEHRASGKHTEGSIDLFLVSGGVFQIFEIVGILDLENKYPPWP